MNDKTFIFSPCEPEITQSKTTGNNQNATIGDSTDSETPEDERKNELGGK